MAEQEERSEQTQATQAPQESPERETPIEQVRQLKIRIEQLEKELDARMGFTEAQISSARELGGTEKQALEAQIAKTTGKKVRATYGLDPSLLGGAIVRIGSTIYDGSVKGQLERIKEAISS